MTEGVGGGVDGEGDVVFWCVGGRVTVEKYSYVDGRFVSWRRNLLSWEGILERVDKGITNPSKVTWQERWIFPVSWSTHR